MFEKEAEELFKNKPLGYEMKPELEIYTDGFNDGYNKAKEEMQKNGLALQSDMDKTIEQNISLKEQIEKMKLCQNCKFADNDFMEEPCRNCSRCLGEDIKREGTSDKWELEND